MIDTPTVSATDLYNNATRDRSSGKLDLALNEFSDYLKWYGNTDLAANAQYYIASIHYSQADYDDALASSTWCSRSIRQITTRSRMP